MAAAGVEIAGRLVGEDDFWIGNERAGDSDTLLLAAGKLSGEEVFSFFEVKAFEGVGSFFES